MNWDFCWIIWFERVNLNVVDLWEIENGKIERNWRWYVDRMYDGDNDDDLVAEWISLDADNDMQDI